MPVQPILKIATWNVNSVRVRLPHLQTFIREERPEVLMLQELKCTAEQFPKEAFEDLGYNTACVGQKSFNGVALLSTQPIDIIEEGFHDQEARFIKGMTHDLLFMSVYVPNGGASGAFQYKLDFLNRLYQEIRHLDGPFVMAGDFNVAHTECDLWNPVEQLCFTMPERRHLHAFYTLGLCDALRLSTPETPNAPGPYTWWDYRTRGFLKNQGMRLDYVFLSPDLQKRHAGTRTAEKMRGEDQASDHVPVITELRAA